MGWTAEESPRWHSTDIVVRFPLPLVPACLSACVAIAKERSVVLYWTERMNDTVRTAV
jgi:hypothetical protein